MSWKLTNIQTDRQTVIHFYISNWRTQTIKEGSSIKNRAAHTYTYIHTYVHMYVHSSIHIHMEFLIELSVNTCSGNYNRFNTSSCLLLLSLWLASFSSSYSSSFNIQLTQKRHFLEHDFLANVPPMLWSNSHKWASKFVSDRH